MLHLSPLPPSDNGERKTLAHIRYRAKKRGFRVLRDGTGNFSVISTQTEPPRPLLGIDHVPLWVIEQVILTPLPESAPRRKRMANPAAPRTTADHFLTLVNAPKTQGAQHEPR
jgi:hypothetical protein